MVYKVCASTNETIRQVKTRKKGQTETQGKVHVTTKATCACEGLFANAKLLMSDAFATGTYAVSRSGRSAGAGRGRRLASNGCNASFESAQKTVGKNHRAVKQAISDINDGITKPIMVGFVLEKIECLDCQRFRNSRCVGVEGVPEGLLLF